MLLLHVSVSLRTTNHENPYAQRIQQRDSLQMVANHEPDLEPHNWHAYSFGIFYKNMYDSHFPN